MRRFTLCLLATIFGGLTMAGCTSARIAKTPEPPARFKIVDAHMHTHFTGKPNRFSGIIDSEASLLKEMADNGVMGGVVHTAEYDKDYFDLSRHHIIHCAGITAKVDEKKLEAGLKAGRFKCLKIYLGYIYQYAYDPAYEPAYRLAEKYNVPVVFHTGDTSESDALLKYSNPMTIDEVAVKHRKITFVIAHLGNPWVETAAEVVYKNPNVYADVSAFLIGDLAQTAPEKVDEYVVKPIAWAYGFIEDPTKLMYGTDWPLTNMKSYITAVQRAIPQEHWNDVFYANTVRVFKIPGLVP